MFLEPMTWLAQVDTPIADAKLIFDKVGTVYYLSEVWLPGKDGFLVQATKENTPFGFGVCRATVAVAPSVCALQLSRNDGADSQPVRRRGRP